MWPTTCDVNSLACHQVSLAFARLHRHIWRWLEKCSLVINTIGLVSGPIGPQSAICANETRKGVIRGLDVKKYYSTGAPKSIALYDAASDGLSSTYKQNISNFYISALHQIQDSIVSIFTIANFARKFHY